MAEATAELVAEALFLIEAGELRLEEGPSRYGPQWEIIQPAVGLALRVNQAAHPPLVSQRPFQPLDKAAGWNTLQAQLATVRPTSPTPLPPVTSRPRLTWQEWLAGLFSSGLGRAGTTVFAALVLMVTLGFGVSTAQPGDWLYRAKLGWDFLGEASNLSPDGRAEAAVHYAERRLAELEKLAFVGRPEQVAEAQSQYLRGLEASLKYTNQPSFTEYTTVYSQLSDQRVRLTRLQQADYAFGPRSQLSFMLDRLDYAVYNLAPRTPTGPPAPTEPTPPTPLPTR